MGRTWLYDENHTEPYREGDPGKGCVFGLLLGIMIWGLIIGAALLIAG